MQTETSLRNGSPQTGGFAHPHRNVGALSVESGMHVADFGSGSGAYVLAIAERLEGTGHVYAVDIQKELLRRISNEAARRGFKNVDVVWADLEEPRASKLAEGIMDLVLVSNILFQVSDKAAVLSEARRILKPKGRLAIIDWSDSPPASGRRLGPITEEVVKKEAAVELARKTGFELVKEFPAGAHHYGLILRPVAKAQ